MARPEHGGPVQGNIHTGHRDKYCAKKREKWQNLNVVAQYRVISNKHTGNRDKYCAKKGKHGET